MRALEVQTCNLQVRVGQAVSPVDELFPNLPNCRPSVFGLDEPRPPGAVLC